MFTNVLVLGALTTSALAAYESSYDALIIGDWGNFGNLDNQKAVAAVMDTWAGVQQSQVVLSLGDNFYSTPNSSYNYEGVKSADDKKFKDLWSNVYSGTSLKSLPWWMVLGNHDWYLNKSQIYELEYSHPNWQLPDFFYTKRVEVADNTWASFIFIETDLLNYGYSGKSGWDMGNNFKSHDWVPAQKTVEKQLAWLDNALAKANNDAYVFILGHHTGFACGADVTGSKFMQNVTNLVNKWDASAYINGHHHTLAYYNTNGGKTLQVQVGSGGNLDGTCPPLTNATGQEAAEYGFAHLRLTKSAASFDFVNIKNAVLFSASVKPRSPVTGVLANTTYLTTDSDPAIHFKRSETAVTATYAAAAPATGLYSASASLALSLVAVVLATMAL